MKKVENDNPDISSGVLNIKSTKNNENIGTYLIYLGIFGAATMSIINKLKGKNRKIKKEVEEEKIEEFRVKKEEKLEKVENKIQEIGGIQEIQVEERIGKKLEGIKLEKDDENNKQKRGGIKKPYLERLKKSLTKEEERGGLERKEEKEFEKKEDVIKHLKEVIASRKDRRKYQAYEIEIKREVFREVQKIVLDPLQCTVEEMFDRIDELNNEIKKRKNSIEILKKENERGSIIRRVEKRIKFKSYQEPRKFPKNRDIEQMKRNIQSEEENYHKANMVVNRINREIKKMLSQKERFIEKDIKVLEKIRDKIISSADYPILEESDGLSKEFNELIRYLKEKREKKKLALKSMINRKLRKSKIVRNWIDKYRMEKRKDYMNQIRNNRIKNSRIKRELSRSSIESESSGSDASSFNGRNSPLNEQNGPEAPNGFSAQNEVSNFNRPNEANGSNIMNNPNNTSNTVGRVNDLNRASSPNKMDEWNGVDDPSASPTLSYHCLFPGISFTSIILPDNLSVGSSVGSLGVEKNTRGRELSEKDIERLNKKIEELKGKIEKREIILKRLTCSLERILTRPREQEKKRLVEKIINTEKVEKKKRKKR